MPLFVDHSLASSFGVMQGRLSPQSLLGYQAFPWETWKIEFPLAAERSFTHIEWVLDQTRTDSNPLLANTSEVSALSAETGVAIASVCADFLMDTPLVKATSATWSLFERSLQSMAEVGATHLVMPFVDQSSMRSVVAPGDLVRIADRVGELANAFGIRVWIEADLPPEEFRCLLQDLDPAVFGVNFDSGNSAALGYVVTEEWAAYGERVGLVHIKDRVLGGRSVPLGTGAADLPALFAAMRIHQFFGLVTMQAYRDHDGVQALDSQIDVLRPLLARSVG